jgi:hypothetical protein
MKKLLLILIASFSFWSCSKTDDKKYSGNQLEFNLFQSSEYDFRGRLLVKELLDGNLELTLKMTGPKSSSEYLFPAHLHFGSYDQANSSIASLLNPVSSKTLESVTVLGALSDGSRLDFQAMKLFDGHVKIHLANDGPDYGVILVAGNIGSNPTANFQKDKMSVCRNGF